MWSRPECNASNGAQDTSQLLIFNSQLQTNAAGADAYNGMLDCFRKIIKQEG